jgi:hypothetical protein
VEVAGGCCDVGKLDGLQNTEGHREEGVVKLRVVFGSEDVLLRSLQSTFRCAIYCTSVAAGFAGSWLLGRGERKRGDRSQGRGGQQYCLAICSQAEETKWPGLTKMHSEGQGMLWNRLPIRPLILIPVRLRHAR